METNSSHDAYTQEDKTSLFLRSLRGMNSIRVVPYEVVDVSHDFADLGGMAKYMMPHDDEAPVATEDMTDKSE